MRPRKIADRLNAAYLGEKGAAARGNEDALGGRFENPIIRDTPLRLDVAFAPAGLITARGFLCNSAGGLVA
jgi:hypothetical protein